MIRALLLLLLLAACTAAAPPETARVPLPDAAFTREAVAFLNTLQEPSIRENREYCGYFGVGRAGEFRYTPPRRGDELSCRLPARPVGFRVTSSYHTHAAFDHYTDSEVPSSSDIITDMDDRTFGYIATPGGRIWLVDWRTAVARQVCGIGCVTSDPAFVPGDAGTIKERYSLNEIRNREW